MIDKATAADPYQPRMRWEDMGDYETGMLVLARNAERQVFGYRQDRQWFELVDGDEIPLGAFEPIEWCSPPGGANAWG